LSHSHIPVRYLIRQLDGLRAQRKARDHRPAWLVDFINAAADWFEPLDGLGRVGFDARPAEGRWEVVLYLGSTELVGGPQDGGSQPAAFSFDVLGLLQSFSRIDHVSWIAQAGPDDVPGCCVGGASEDTHGKPPIEARLAVEGQVAGNAVALQVCSVPPREAGPGFRRYADGRRDAV
jgi:hypothetical protein